MAAEDFGDKTHEATPYRRQKAREEGQVVRSQDLASAGLLIAGLLVLWYLSRGLSASVAGLTTEHLGGEAWLKTDADSIVHHSVMIAAKLVMGVLPVLGLLLLGAI